MCFEPFDLTHTTDLLTAILSLFWRFFLNAIRYDSPAPIILASSPNNPRLSTHKQKMKHLVHFPAPTPRLHKKTSQHTTDLKRAVKQNTHAFHHQISSCASVSKNTKDSRYRRFVNKEDKLLLPRTLCLCDILVTHSNANMQHFDQQERVKFVSTSGRSKDGALQM